MAETIKASGRELEKLQNNEAVDKIDGETSKPSRPKKQILLNAFDMSTVGHLSPGQWKV